jgi:hypothetical protein
MDINDPTLPRAGWLKPLSDAEKAAAKNWLLSYGLLRA